MKLKRKIQIIGLLSVVTLIITVLAGELFIFLFNPQELVSPTLKTKEYLFQYPPNTTVNHKVGRHTRQYTTNTLGHRKMEVTQGDNVILLGDSFTFGMGVEDNYEWGSVLQSNTDCNIVNLGMSGWGLTQEIKRFYEVGMDWKPKAVILMFCENDILDNTMCPVTKVKDGKFVFEDLELEDTKKSLGERLFNPLAIRSQLFRFFRRRAYTNERIKQIKSLSIAQEIIYSNLLSTFAEDMKQRGVDIFFISVNNLIDENEVTQLSKFKQAEESVLKLDSLNLIKYINSNELVQLGDYITSPVGHYSIEWNKAIGEGLANTITKWHQKQI